MCTSAFRCIFCNLNVLKTNEDECLDYFAPELQTAAGHLKDSGTFSIVGPLAGYVLG